MAFSTTRGQKIVIATLLMMYASFYLCRANVNAAFPLLEAEGYSKTQLGTIETFTIATYAIGKLVMGALCDRMGGRRIILVAMVGSVAASLAIGVPPGLGLIGVFPAG